MMELLLPAVVSAVIIIALIVIIKAKKRKTRNEVKTGLEEADENHIKVIEAGSNFKTRMRDLRESMENLDKATSERYRLVSELKGGTGNGRRSGRAAEEAGEREEIA